MYCPFITIHVFKLLFLLCAFAHSASIIGKSFSAPSTSTVPLNSNFFMK